MLFVLTLLTAAAVLIVPGFIAIAPLRLRILAHLALAGPTSLALIGVTGIFGGLLHIRFFWWQPFIPSLIVATAVLCIITLRERNRHVPQSVLPEHKLTWQPFLQVVAWAVSAAAFAVVFFHQVDIGSWSQTYDNLFHLNATQSILETGNASSLQLRTLINTDKTFSTYPAGWHTAAAMICQVTGVSVPTAFNALAIAVNAVLWLPGLAWLTAVLSPKSQRETAITMALLLGSAFGFFPYALLVWGVLYPTYLAYALFPSGLALAIAIVHAWLPRLLKSPSQGPEQSAEIGRWTLLSLALVWLLGACFTHPRSLVSFVLLLLPLILTLLLRAFLCAWRAGGRPRRRALWWTVLITVGALGTGGAATLVVFRVFHVAERPVSDHLNGPQAMAVQTFWDGIGQVLSQSALTGVADQATGPIWGLALLVVCSLVFALSRSDLRWLVTAYLLSALLFALAAGSDSELTKILTGLWYKDRFRLSALLPITAVPLVSLMMAQAIRQVRNSHLRVAVVLVASVCSWLSLAGPWGSAAAREYRLADQKGTDFIDAPQADFMQTALQLVPAGERVLGDPWDGSALSWIYGSREPVFPHLTGQWDADRLLIASALPEIQKNPDICNALDRLNVRYVLSSSGALDGGDPSGNRFSGVHAAVDQGLFTQVESDGITTLYRIDQCGGTVEATS